MLSHEVYRSPVETGYGTLSSYPEDCELTEFLSLFPSPILLKLSYFVLSTVFYEDHLKTRKETPVKSIQFYPTHSSALDHM
jgi:hypothetical protein